MKTKKFSFQKKIQVWDQSTNQIPHLYFFLKWKFFSFQKNLQVLNQPLVIFFRKSLGHSQIQKKSRQKWLSPNLTLRKDLYMDTPFIFSLNAVPMKRIEFIIGIYGIKNFNLEIVRYSQTNCFYAIEYICKLGKFSLIKFPINYFFFRPLWWETMLNSPHSYSASFKTLLWRILGRLELGFCERNISHSLTFSFIRETNKGVKSQLLPKA